VQRASQFNTQSIGASVPKPHLRHDPYPFSYSVGERIGENLRVLDRVSAGPFTELYRVWSERRVGVFVCKIMREGIADEELHRRAIEQEWRTLRRIEHPNVVRVFRPEEDLEVPHLLMEWVVGPSLLDLIGQAPRRRLKPNVAIRFAVGIGAALAAVHKIGYLYRDLKPANVLVRDGEPVLIDFGVVYRWKPGQRPRDRAGTDPYMAPEQCLGEALTPAADVFGLGAVTYEMLTGEWPFEDQLMNVFDRKKLRNRFPQIVHEALPARRRVHGLDRAVDEVVARCLARDPQRRFQSIGDAVMAFNLALDQADRVFPDGDGDAVRAA
jgi:serine/threonine protein kinase